MSGDVLRTFCFTSVTSAYLPNARILADSVRKHHPDWHFILLFNDLSESSVDWMDEPFDEIFYAHWLPIPNFRQWAFDYSVVEFCTATKGTMSEYLFEKRGADRVIYLDPDTAVFTPLVEVEELLNVHDVILTPHLTDREYDYEGIWSHEMAALKHGVFNLGFFAIANRENGRAFTEWWAERLRDHSHIDHNRGLFTDQKWCNLAPYMFDGIHVLCDRAYNIATWNMMNRKISQGPDGQWLVNGNPVRFYHFSGFGNDFAWADRELEAFTEEGDFVRDIWRWYKEQYKKWNRKDRKRWMWGRFENGQPITPTDRERYRKEEDLRHRHPNPFTHDTYLELRA